MEDKNINETEITEITEATETAQTVAESNESNAESDKKVKKAFFKALKNGKNKKLKNQALFKRGGYSLAVTALFLVAVILFNWLVSALADRFNLEFDMTKTKENTITAENLDYVKGIKQPVSIIFCADEEEYASGMMSSYAQYYYQVSDSNEAKYYNQTLSLVKKYADINKNIKVEFIDTQSTEFAEIASKYPNENIAYGSIIVSSEIKSADGKATPRYKVIGYEDIYTLSDESGMSAYGYGGYTIGGNNIETALTSAISIVTSSESKKVLFITGHSSADYSEDYKKLLEANGYGVTVSSDKAITSVSNEYDAVAILAPNRDFLGSELDKISEFLDNGEGLGKGLIYFADATSPVLPNLCEFLSDWGIEQEDGMLFETESSKRVGETPYDVITVPGEDDITKGMNYCITGYNVPLSATEPADDRIGVTSLMTTTLNGSVDTVVVAPKGAGNTWKDYSDKDKSAYAGVIQAEKTDMNANNEEVSSYIIAFSSIEFIYSDWAEYNDLSNKNIALASTDRASGLENTGISFVQKVIVNESFSQTVSESDVALIRIIFMILLPVVTAALGVFIFIRRKNA